MKPPQEITDFLMNETLLWEWQHPHIPLITCRRKAQSLIHDCAYYLHPNIKTYLTKPPSI